MVMYLIIGNIMNITLGTSMSQEERRNELTSFALLDAKADKLRLDYLESIVEDAKMHLFDNWHKYGSIRAAIDHAMKTEGATNSFL